MTGQVIILATERQRVLAKQLVDRAPAAAVVEISEARRTNDQNAKFWSMLSDLSRAKPDGRRHTPETWKALAMHACGHAVRFEQGLDGEPFPVGFRSSRLTKSQMSVLIEFLYEFGSRHDIKWSDEQGKPK